LTIATNNTRKLC